MTRGDGGRDHGGSRVTLATLLDYSFLKKHVWKPFLDRQRKTRIRDTELVHDPFDHSAFHSDLKQELTTLALLARSGTWQAQGSVLVRSAKRAAIHRPLTYLNIDDSLLLNALSATSQPSFHARLPPYVSYGRADPVTQRRERQRLPPIQRSPQTPLLLNFWDPSDTWYYQWLQHMGLLATLRADPSPLVALSDVATFFPSVDLDILHQMLIARSNVDLRAIDLLMSLLLDIRSTDWRLPEQHLGLPQEPHDASRLLAHGYLLPLDLELADEGAAHGYARWMDDITVSVPSRQNGKEVLARIQRALDSVALTPNTAKSRIVTKSEFKKEQWISHNAYLDGCQERLDTGIPEQMDRFHRKLRVFLAAKRTGYYERVLRRWYTLSSSLSSASLQRHAAKHLEDIEGLSAHIFDYLARRPFSLGRAHEVEAAVRRLSCFYDDVPIRWYEYLLTAPNRNSQTAKRWIVRTASQHLAGGRGYAEPNAYLAGLISLVIFKFGEDRDLRPIAQLSQRNLDPLFLRQAYVCLRASDRFRDTAADLVRYRSDRGLVRLRRLCDDSEADIGTHLHLTRSYFRPTEWQTPQRWIFRARALPLVAMMARSQDPQQRLSHELDAIVARLRTTRPNLQDRVTIARLIQIRQRL